jgi:hypothetical protein
VRRVYAPFFMTITETDPGNVPHRELMIGGNPGNIGMSSGVLGVSPWACGVPLVNTIAFVFSAAHGDNIPELCWTATHEAGHLFGLDHEFHQPDSMSYDPLTTQYKHFTDFNSECFDQSTGQQIPATAEVLRPRIPTCVWRRIWAATACSPMAWVKTRGNCRFLHLWHRSLSGHRCHVEHAPTAPR